MIPSSCRGRILQQSHESFALELAGCCIWCIISFKCIACSVLAPFLSWEDNYIVEFEYPSLSVHLNQNHTPTYFASDFCFNPNTKVIQKRLAQSSNNNMKDKGIHSAKLLFPPISSPNFGYFSLWTDFFVWFCLPTDFGNTMLAKTGRKIWTVIPVHLRGIAGHFLQLVDCST